MPFPARLSSKHLLQTFATGAIAILPLALTLAVLAWIVKILHDLAGPASFCGTLFRSVGMSVVACEVMAYVFGLIGAFAVIYLLGTIIESNALLRWRRTIDDALHRVPVFGTVYDASKQMTSMFERKPDSRQSMSPVMCFFGEGRGAATPALMPTAELVRIGGIEYHVVMIPTAPVPFGGALILVKSDWVEPAGCGFEELVGIYMSMGVTAPRCLTSGDQTATPPAAPTGNS